MKYVVTLIVCTLITGCVSGNKAEVNAIKIEKQSTAKEVDQYVTTTGKVLQFIGVSK